MNREYDDILSASPPSAPSPMPRPLRAAQFAPFAALTGLEDALAETARLTTRRVPLSEEDERALNAAFASLCERLPSRPTVTLLCFEEDGAKDGGRYVLVTGRVRTVDDTVGELVMEDRRRIPLSAICNIDIFM